MFYWWVFFGLGFFVLLWFLELVGWFGFGVYFGFVLEIS